MAFIHPITKRSYPDDYLEKFYARRRGEIPTGDVFLFEFDRGVVETLGGMISEEHGEYYVPIDGVLPPPGWPGIPVVFQEPQVHIEHHRVPVITVLREDISTDMERYHPGQLKYRAPAPGANMVSVNTRGGVLTGPTHIEQQLSPWPVEISYTLNAYALDRSLNARISANRILKRLMRAFPPYNYVYVLDSVGDYRVYPGFVDSYFPMDVIGSVSERVVGFGLSLRIKGELDILDAQRYATVTNLPEINLTEG